MLTVPSGVLSIDFHPKYPYMLVAGMVDGNVAVFNLKRFINVVKSKIRDDNNPF